jgi:hypothetical protein
LRAKGQQKNSIQFIKAGKDKNLNFGLGAGGGLFFYFQGKIFRMAFLQKSDAFKVGKAGEKLGFVGLVIQRLIESVLLIASEAKPQKV